MDKLSLAISTLSIMISFYLLNKQDYLYDRINELQALISELTFRKE